MHERRGYGKCLLGNALSFVLLAGRLDKPWILAGGLPLSSGRSHRISGANFDVSSGVRTARVLKRREDNLYGCGGIGINGAFYTLLQKLKQPKDNWTLMNKLACIVAALTF